MASKEFQESTLAVDLKAGKKRLEDAQESSVIDGSLLTLRDLSTQELYSVELSTH